VLSEATYETPAGDIGGTHSIEVSTNIAICLIASLPFSPRQCRSFIKSCEKDVELILSANLIVQCLAENAIFSHGLEHSLFSNRSQIELLTDNSNDQSASGSLRINSLKGELIGSLSRTIAFKVVM